MPTPPSKAAHTEDPKRPLVIPADIWEDIFIRCLADSELPLIPSIDHPPLLFTSICRSWRDIALQTPKLWDSLCLKWSGPSDRDNNMHHLRAKKDGVEQWLARSEPLPLTISLEATRRPLITQAITKLSDAILLTIIQLFVQHSRRLKSLSISGGSSVPQMLPPLLQLTGDDIPILQEYHEVGTGELTSVIAVNSPSLRKLQFDNATKAFLTISFSWSRLTDLQITFISERFIIENVRAPLVLQILARRCTSLVRCSLIFTSESFRGIPGVPESPIVWTPLQHLTLSFTSKLTTSTRSVLQHTFDSIRTPNLTHLELAVSPGRESLRYTSHFSPTSEHPLHQFLLESGCHLTSLWLYLPFGPSVLPTLGPLLSPSLKLLAIKYFSPREMDGTALKDEDDVYTPDGDTVSMTAEYLMPGADSSLNLPHLEVLEVMSPPATLAKLLKELELRRELKRMKIWFGSATMSASMVESGFGPGVHWDYGLWGT